ncbi:hypothetical protein UFOVP130_22 [uncultured Caudovirales phage]|uniref:Uncharacterized protein n=1 Tax=uncultured Caudovirales phage TaxID=2100421 RepID=A0A6J5L9I8_9CAUD|nr:hypothetical protein UFOVP130_22 [uncultured Caudovirales phage]
MPDTTFAASMPVKQLDAKHADYALYHDGWNDIELICQSGILLKKKAESFLAKRPKELAEVYAQRIRNFTHQDVLGTALGWYVAAMFKDDPDIHLMDEGGADIESDPKDFYSQFQSNCDRAGTTYVNFFRRLLPKLLKFRSVYVLLDLPKPGDDTPAPATLADQKSSGALDPYLVLYDPRQAINWECDAYGNLMWIVFAVTTDQRVFGKGRTVIDRWYYFDRTQYAVYEAERVDGATGQKAGTTDAAYIDAERPANARLVDSGPHALADAGRVPVQCIQVPEDMWLGNRCYLNAMTHLNLQNALFWGLLMGCLPVLYVKGQFVSPPTMSETGYLEIAEGGDIGYVEPSGVSYQIASENIDKLREEMYRQLYLQAQGRSTAATPAAQSGLSKEMDMAPSRDVLNGLGDILRAAMRDVLIDVASIRGEDTKFDVRGLTFDDDNEAEELTSAQLASDLNIPSDTLEKEIQKRVARALLKDARPEVVQRVEAEIDAAPGKTEREAEAKKEQQLRIGAAFQSSFRPAKQEPQ